MRCPTIEACGDYIRMNFPDRRAPFLRTKIFKNGR
jgi:hypothetical protein